MNAHQLFNDCGHELPPPYETGREADGAILAAALTDDAHRVREHAREMVKLAIRARAMLAALNVEGLPVIILSNAAREMGLALRDAYHAAQWEMVKLADAITAIHASLPRHSIAAAGERDTTAARMAYSDEWMQGLPAGAPAAPTKGDSHPGGATTPAGTHAPLAGHSTPPAATKPQGAAGHTCYDPEEAARAGLPRHSPEGAAAGKPAPTRTTTKKGGKP